jgi:16S rRNA (cytidine1402-2'-O)-methyltransferase
MLYLIPSFISENTSTLPENVLIVIRDIDEFIVENEKSARQFLKDVKTNIRQEKFIFHLLNEHSSGEDISKLKNVIIQKKNIGLLSEAGCPGIADPGSDAVRIAHENNIRVIPLTGPSSIFLALMASGMNGQQFAFHGYLPKDQEARKKKIQALEKDANKFTQTQIFIEAPYRNQNVLNDLLAVCNNNTKLCIAVNLTSENESVKTKSIESWKKNIPGLNKQQVIFLIG